MVAQRPAGYPLSSRILLLLVVLAGGIQGAGYLVNEVGFDPSFGMGAGTPAPQGTGLPQDGPVPLPLPGEINALEPPIIEPVVIVEESSSAFFEGLYYTLLQIRLLPILLLLRHFCIEKHHLAQRRVTPPRSVIERLDDIAAPEQQKLVVRSLFQRSAMLRQNSSLLLFLIIVLIFVGVYLYNTAGNLVSSDINQDPFAEMETLLESVSNRRVALETRMENAQTLREDVWTRLRAVGVNFTPPPDPAESLAFAGDGCRFSRDLYAGAYPRYPLDEAVLARAGADLPCNDSDVLRDLLEADATYRGRIINRAAEIAAKTATIEGIERYLSENLSQLIDAYASGDKNVRERLIASGVTRFGVLLVVIYLVQILVRIHRYNLRLADFLDARAGALILAGDNLDNLGAWKDQLASDEIDFGKAPVPPSGYVTRLFEQWTSQRAAKERSGD